MTRTPGIEPPNNILKKTLIFLVILLIVWIIGVIYVLTPRPLTNDTYGQSPLAILSQQVSII